jgi:hypothetical protein
VVYLEWEINQEKTMGRKSRELRLSQAQALVEDYESAGLGKDRNCQFARDMCWRLENNKSLSPKRRNWLDSIIEEGVPAPKGDVALLSRLQSAAAVKGMTDFDSKILIEFAGKIRRGWDLSPKQKLWMNKLLDKASDMANHGPWVPSKDMTDSLRKCIELASGYSVVYWETHTGSWKALQNVKEYIRDPENNTVDEWSAQKLLKAMRRPLRELIEPKFDIGEMYWSQSLPALVIEGPYIGKSGKVMYKALVDGKLVETVSLSKRAPKSG